jgi:TolB protein
MRKFFFLHITLFMLLGACGPKPVSSLIPQEPTISNTSTISPTQKLSPLGTTPTLKPVPSETLPSATEEAAKPTPFGGGSRIAFSSNRDGNYEIYIMNSDGTDPIRLTDSPTNDWSPQLDLAGEFLLYWSVSDNPPLNRMYWMRADGSKQGIFADHIGPNADISSPGLVVFETYSEYGTRDIVAGVVGMLDGGIAQLTDHPGTDAYPDWSPDGKTIAFVSDRDGLPHIYLMNWDGTNQRRLTKSEMVELQPDWSPDGSMIVFFSGDDTKTNLYIINSNGTNVRQLTEQEDNYNENPVWSPDGTMIAFWSNRTGNKEIYSIKIDGSGLINLTNDPGDDENPTWSK